MLLDLDGTLYHQNRLRLRMAWELLRSGLGAGSIGEATTLWRSIRAFRRVREELRDLGYASESLERAQYARAAERVAVPRAVIEQIVAEWIFIRPLRHMAACRRAGLEGFLAGLLARGITAGVFSDYPVVEKARALGISPQLSLMLCATEPEINAFKPDPRGFRHAAGLWGIEPAEILYVGDRPEVDAAGATAAGMPCAILSRRGSCVVRSWFGSYLAVRSFQALGIAIAEGLSAAPHAAGHVRGG